MRAGETTPQLARYPNQVMAMDIFGPMPISTENHRWVLTMIDQFTRWPVAVPIPDRNSETIADAIYKHWVCEKGVPHCIISDRGRELISKGIQQLCKRMDGYQKGDDRRV